MRALDRREGTLLAAALACVAAPVLVAAWSGSPVTVAAVVLLLALAPGAVLVPLLAPQRGRASEIGLVLGCSLAVSTLLAQGMLWLDAWSPEALTYGVAALCLPLILAHLAGRPRRFRRQPD